MLPLAIRITSRMGRRPVPPVRAAGGIGTAGSADARAACSNSASVVVTTTVTGAPRCCPSPPEAIAVLSAELDRVVAALLGASRISLVGVGLMPAGADHGGDRLEIRAGLRVQPAGQPAHAVGPLPSQHQPAAAGAILVGEVAVGIQAVGDGLPDRR